MEKQLPRLTAALLLALFSIFAVPAMSSMAAGNQASGVCQQNGWRNLERADGTTFANQGACVRYVSQGGAPVRIQPTVTLTFEPTTDPSLCIPIIHLNHFEPNTPYTVVWIVWGQMWLMRAVLTDDVGSATQRTDIFAQGTQFAASVDTYVSDTMPVSC